MSSAVFSTSAAQSRPFVFDNEEEAAVCPQPTGVELFGEGRPPRRVIPAGNGAFGDAKLAGVTSASRLAVRPAPEMVSSGIAEMDALTGGLPRGCLTEICGPASSGRTTLLLSALAAATRRGEFCAVVDAGDALDPQSAAASGIEFERLLWVRCGESFTQKDNSPQRRRGTEKINEEQDQDMASRFEQKDFGWRGASSQKQSEHCLEQLLGATDLLLESGGFGLIALDLADLPQQVVRRIPLTTWFRFRRAVEHTSTVLLAIQSQSIAGSCSSLLIKLGLTGNRFGGQEMNSQLPGLTHAQLLTGLEFGAEIVRSRMDRKPARSAEITFASKTAWAG
jgi:recombination protein RecA